MKAHLLRALPDTDIGVSPFSDTAAIQSAYARIKEEIDWLEAATREWKQRHNSLNIMARLPPEVLSAVFKCVVAAFGSHDMGWTKIITHVCSHWRRVALDCPSLWTSIHFSHPSWVDVMLQRSKLAPLTIMAVVSNQDVQKMQLLKTALMTRMSQIKSLSVNQYRSNRFTVTNVLNDVVHPAHLLETLCVHFTARDSVYALPEHIFSGQAPRLRELDLLNCGLSWQSPLLRGLTRLTVRCVPRAMRASMSELMGALSNMPNLQSLDLSQILLTGSGAGGYEAPIVFPHLTRLAIEFDISETTFLLDHLIYPPTAVVILICTLSSSAPDSQDMSCNLPLISRLGRVFSKFQRIRCLQAIYTKGIRLLASDTLLPRTWPRNPKTPSDSCRVDITLKSGGTNHSSHGEDAWADQIHRNLWKSLPMMADLEKLYVDDDRLECRNKWHDIFGSLGVASNLRILEVRECSGIGFLRAFSSDALAPLAEEPEGRVPLKLVSLRELAIQHWVFREVEAGRTCLELLQACLQDRRKRRAEIAELSLANCWGISGSDIGKLREIVKTVSWDGLELPPKVGFACQRCDYDTSTYQGSRYLDMDGYGSSSSE